MVHLSTQRWWFCPFSRLGDSHHFTSSWQINQIMVTVKLKDVDQLGSQWWMDASVMKRTLRRLKRENVYLWQTHRGTSYSRVRSFEIYTAKCWYSLFLMRWVWQQNLWWRPLQRNPITPSYLLKKWLSPIHCAWGTHNGESARANERDETQESIINTVQDQRRGSAAGGFGAAQSSVKSAGQLCWNKNTRAGASPARG